MLLRREYTAIRYSAAALDDRMRHQIPRSTRGNKGSHAHSTSALPQDGDVRWISAKLGDIFLNPLQRSYLVIYSIIAGSPLAFSRKLRMREESEYADAVVDGDHNHTSGSPRIPIHGDFVSPAVIEGPSMYPHGDRKPRISLSDCLRRSPHIQVQTVFVHSRKSVLVKLLHIERRRVESVLHGNMPVMIGDHYRIP